MERDIAICTRKGGFIAKDCNTGLTAAGTTLMEAKLRLTVLLQKNNIITKTPA